MMLINKLRKHLHNHEDESPVFLSKVIGALNLKKLGGIPVSEVNLLEVGMP